MTADDRRLLIGTLAVGALLVAFYVWVGTMNADFSFGARQDPYNEVASAFRHGRTSLDLPVPDGLRNVANPYDAAQRGPFVDSTITDLSYFEGKLYAYWGPAPAALLFLPAQVLGFDSMPPLLALLVLLLGGLACAALFLRGLIVRHFPGTPPWMQLAALATLGLCGLGPYLLQNSRMYEIAIAGGYCFVWAGLLALAHALWRRPASLPLLALASACFGLAFLSRPNVAVVAVTLPVAGWWLWRRNGRSPLGVAAAAAAPFAVCVALFALYNHARFGSFTDFGYRYLLSGLDQYDKPVGKLSYIPPGLWYYLVAPVRWRLQFPFAYLPPPPLYPFTPPKDWTNVEMTGGVLWTTPFLLVLGALPFAWRRLGTELRVILGGLAAAGLVVAVALAFAIFGVVQRYEADFVTLLLVAALGTWLWLARSARTAGRRRAIRRVGAVALAYGGVIAAATSLNGAGPWLKDARPGTFDALERFFGFVPSVYAAVTGSPHVVAVDHAASIRPAGITRLTLDGAEFLLGKNGATVQVASPSAGPAVLVARVQPLTPWTFRSQLAIRARASPGGSSAVVGFAQPRTGEIPVQLARGLNDITLEAVGQPPLRGLATDPDANTILHVLSLKVRKG